MTLKGKGRKIILILIITGWIRVFLIVGPVAYVWFNNVTNDTEMIEK